MPNNLPKYTLTKENTLREDPNGNITFVAQAMELANLHSADAKTAWAECEALREKVAALEAALSAAEPQPAPSVTVKVTPEALEQFTAYFVKNYPGPDTIIFDPKWHAPKIFRAAVSVLSAQVQDVAGGL